MGWFGVLGLLSINGNDTVRQITCYFMLASQSIRMYLSGDIAKYFSKIANLLTHLYFETSWNLLSLNHNKRISPRPKERFILLSEQLRQ